MTMVSWITRYVGMHRLLNQLPRRRSHANFWVSYQVLREEILSQKFHKFQRHKSIKVITPKSKKKRSLSLAATKKNSPLKKLNDLKVAIILDATQMLPRHLYIKPVKWMFFRSKIDFRSSK